VECRRHAEWPPAELAVPAAAVIDGAPSEGGGHPAL